MTSPVCEPLRKLIGTVGDTIGIACKDGGVGVTINGPRFSTKAESKMYQMIGGDFVNMDFASEVSIYMKSIKLNNITHNIYRRYYPRKQQCYILVLF